jgi:hypothetical protein
MGLHLATPACAHGRAPVHLHTGEHHTFTPTHFQAPWLYLIETDYLFLKPVAAPGPAELDARPLAFRFQYVQPESPALRVSPPPRLLSLGCVLGGSGFLCTQKPAPGGCLAAASSREVRRTPQGWCASAALRPTLLRVPCHLPQAIMRRLYPPGLGPLSDVPHTGPAPVLARVEEWLRVAPRWEGYATQARKGGGLRDCLLRKPGGALRPHTAGLCRRATRMVPDAPCCWPSAGDCRACNPAFLSRTATNINRTPPPTITATAPPVCR